MIEVHRKLFADFPCLNTVEKRYYVVKNAFEMDKKELNNVLASEAERFEINFVKKYLEPTIRLMRLFKEGNICMPLYRYYYLDNGKPKTIMGISTTRYITRESFALAQEEINNLNHFLDNTELPFKHEYLQLAFENFELSYHIMNRGLSFLLLMMSLETLSAPINSKSLRRDISKNAAALLAGRKDKYSKKISSDVKKLYEKRSKIIHTGRQNIVDVKDLVLLRHYARESIKKIYTLNVDKNKLFELLNSSKYSPLKDEQKT
jgi:hypothetical protein